MRTVDTGAIEGDVFLNRRCVVCWAVGELQGGAISHGGSIARAAESGLALNLKSARTDGASAGVGVGTREGERAVTQLPNALGTPNLSSYVNMVISPEIKVSVGRGCPQLQGYSICNASPAHYSGGGNSTVPIEVVTAEAKALPARRIGELDASDIQYSDIIRGRRVARAAENQVIVINRGATIDPIGTIGPIAVRVAIPGFSRRM